MSETGVGAGEKKTLFGGPLQGTTFVFYHLGRVYFKGKEPEGLARYGQSRDHRGDRRLVFLLDCDACSEEFRLLVKLFRGNRSDSKSLLGLLVTLQGWLGIEERTFAFDGGWKKPWELGSAESGEGLRISLELREAKLQEPLSKSSQKIGSFGLPTGVTLRRRKGMGLDR
ncbi:hypothetical protein [Candidatus Methylacidithermus pantelleriae]|uniref:Uncharacterized protein n=1 Tax=Candidatus Methylacidithermus pantelleriae TaxID=2744239 RepID=A0A8J2BJ19_9BACT|nr:hypothetical protein [Candidatus Methylacidithermus pantelleriae]CAF0689935.1 hypothetical protein MPNT_10441 [Candidatus Methylacidithermus pantelleriae]